MSYKLSFTVAPSAQVVSILQSIEHRLNWHVLRGDGTADTDAKGDAGVMGMGGKTGPQCKVGELCIDSNHGPHNPSDIVISLLVGAVVGFLICRLTSKKGKKAQATGAT